MNPLPEARIEGWLGRLSLAAVLPATALVLFLIAWNRGIALLYGMFSLVLGTWIVAAVAPRFNLRGPRVHRTHPASVTAGEAFTLTLELEHPGPRARHLLEVIDRIPCAPAGEREPMVFVERLRGRRRVTLPVTASLRGEHRLGPLRLASGYPLGIRRVERPLPDSESGLLVYPATFPIRGLILTGATRTLLGGNRAATLSGASERFLGVREYRPGDSPRHVHWPSSAHRGELVVKEYELVNTTDLVVALDLSAAAQVGEGEESTLEYAVRIAASIARHALEEGHGVGILGLGQRPREVRVGHGMGHFQHCLELLARVRADGHHPYRETVHQAAGRLPRGGLLVLFDTPPLDRAHAEESYELHRHHIQPLWVRFDSESFRYPARRPSRPQPGPAGRSYRVRRGDDLSRVFSR